MATPEQLERLIENPITYLCQPGGFPVPATLRVRSRMLGHYAAHAGPDRDLNFDCADVQVKGDTVTNVFGSF